MLMTSKAQPSSQLKGRRCIPISQLVVLAVVISCLCALSAEAATETTLARDLRLSDGTYVVYTVVKGVPKWRLLPYLWVDKAINLRWNRGKARAHWHSLLTSI